MSGADSELCPKREDKTHCAHWWVGAPCCGCGAPADPEVCLDCSAVDCDHVDRAGGDYPYEP